MASYGTKHGLRNAIINNENHPLRRYLRDLVQEDGPIRTARLLEKMAAHNQLPLEGTVKALNFLSQEAKANQHILQRRFPDTWMVR